MHLIDKIKQLFTSELKNFIPISLNLLFFSLYFCQSLSLALSNCIISIYLSNPFSASESGLISVSLNLLFLHYLYLFFNTLSMFSLSCPHFFILFNTICVVCLFFLSHIHTRSLFIFILFLQLFFSLSTPVSPYLFLYLPWHNSFSWKLSPKHSLRAPEIDATKYFDAGWGNLLALTLNVSGGGGGGSI